MAYGYKYRPSKAAAQEFAKKMQEIEAFCLENNISSSLMKDSYYFKLNGKNYRVSNHSVEASNNGAYNWLGEKVRDVYHPDGRDSETIYIHASKTRIIEIYNALKEGKKLDGRGRIMEYMTTREAGEKWNVSRVTVSTWIRRGKLPQAKKLGRDWMIPTDTPKPKDRRYVENPIRNRRKREPDY